MKNIRHFFALKKDPFPSEILSKEVFHLPSLKPMQERTMFAINMRCFTVVTGEVGSGKSTSLRYVIDQLGKGEYEVLTFTAGSYSMAEFLRQVLLCFGVVSSSYKTSLMMRQIQEELRAIISKQKTPVLVIDEAHLMKSETFAQLHLLTQWDLDRESLVATILCGQQDLLEKLSNPNARPLASRIMGRSHLEPIRKDVMQQYIFHHMQLAGSKANLFSEDAITAIHQGSGGILRRANLLCRGALLAAALEKNKLVCAEHVKVALTELI